MIIKHLSLTNFRNYGRLDINFGPSVNIIYGDNAQGKTNIIEAISVASCLSSHRTVKDKEMVAFGSSGYEISMQCENEYDNSFADFYVGYFVPEGNESSSNHAKRVLKQDGFIIPKLSEYVGVCNTVIFAPEDLNLVKGAPAVRRRYLNLLISKVSPSYINLLNQCRRLIDQKNLCLKSSDAASGQPDALDFWDYPLSQVSAEIVIKRYLFTCMLSKKARDSHLSISQGLEELSVRYTTISGCIDLIEDFLEERDMFDVFIARELSVALYAELRGILGNYIYSKLVSSRRYDLERGSSTSGVQKDDLEILLNGLPMKQYSSQGQQRSAALSLKLSELQIVRDCVASYPILLLDDVFSELDVNRRVSLISGMVDAQIFITCTDRSYIEKELDALLSSTVKSNFYHVKDGNVEVS